MDSFELSEKKNVDLKRSYIEQYEWGQGCSLDFSVGKVANRLVG
jgi:hypothetical protein